VDWLPIVISFLALALGVANLFRSVRATPKPKLFTYSTIDDEVHTYPDNFGDPVDWQPLTLNVTNRGNGLAHDVRVRLVGAADQEVIELGALQLDDTKPASFNASFKEFAWPGTFELTWVEYPAGKLLKRVIEYGPGKTNSLYGL
jgi:hypothetical protein